MKLNSIPCLSFPGHSIALPSVLSSVTPSGPPPRPRVQRPPEQTCVPSAARPRPWGTLCPCVSVCVFLCGGLAAAQMTAVTAAAQTAGAIDSMIKMVFYMCERQCSGLGMRMCMCSPLQPYQRGRDSHLCSAECQAAETSWCAHLCGAV